ncbi:BON domain-containing protein [Bordetella genomosp. 12]|uniref:Osmotically inducible protein Y n=1 Tax=Bordetella genomosp. 12 TaxID=463035 RepID=A0A261VM29_9BORD|nr:BON domain-containing protein [Bordetella genomosp. 12]OZI74811.1 osmotically inducible protein Y [Bordetella genomosp. 12]
MHKHSAAQRDPGIGEQARDQGKAKSGRVGAQEPGYGKPSGQKPAGKGQQKPNPNGPQYEEGGQYPGPRPGSSRQASAQPERREVISGDLRVGEIVREQLRHSGYDVSAVTVDVHQGCVRLDGMVPDGRTRHGVQSCADSCVGVRGVENHTRVSEASRTGAARH